MSTPPLHVCIPPLSPFNFQCYSSAALGQEDLKENRTAKSGFATIILMKIELYGSSIFSKWRCIITLL